MISITRSTFAAFTRLILMFAILVLAHLPFKGLAQGDIDPSTSPGKTFKTLQQIEPRVEVNSDNTPGDGASVYVIDSPGNYFLAGDINAAPNKTGIHITSRNVTLDLMGFSLNGPGNNSRHGILVEPPSGPSNIVVRNGSVLNFMSATQMGINAVGVDSITIKDVLVKDCGNHGIRTGSASKIINCRVINAGGDGIRADGDAHIADSQVSDAGGDGIEAGSDAHITGTQVSVAAGDGIRTGSDAHITDTQVSDASGGAFRVEHGSLIADCVAERGTVGFTASGSRLRDSVASNASVYGFSLDEGTTAEACTALFNSSHGFRLSDGSSAYDCKAYDNRGHGFNLDSSFAKGCIANENHMQGFQLRMSQADRCVATSNRGAGFFLDTDCVVTASHARDNTSHGFEISKEGSILKGSTSVANQSGDAEAPSAGVYVQRKDGPFNIGVFNIVQNMIVLRNDNGVIVDSKDNIIASNIALDSGTSFKLIDGNGFGDTVNAARHHPVDTEDFSHQTGNLLTNPWANFHDDED